MTEYDSHYALLLDRHLARQEAGDTFVDWCEDNDLDPTDSCNAYAYYEMLDEQAEDAAENAAEARAEAAAERDDGW